MALCRAAGLCRLALRTQWAAARLLTSVAASGVEPPGDEDKDGRVIETSTLRLEGKLRPPAERSQPASPRKTYTTAPPSYEQLQLNKAIKASNSVNGVLDLAASRPAVLNCVIVSTALSVTAKLMGNSEPALALKTDARFKTLMKAALTLMERGEMDAQGFSNMLYACGQLGITPPPSWLHAYFDRSALLLGEFVPQALSNTMYACGQLGIKPPVVWLQHFWRADASKMSFAIPQDFSNTMYACGQLGIVPAPDWLQRFWHASALNMPMALPQDFSTTMYACGQLGIVPPADWLQRYWHASAWKLDEFIPQNLCFMIYACGQLAITPPADWLQWFWQASAPKLVEYSQQHMSVTMYSFAQLGCTPPGEWLLRFWSASAAKMGEFSQQGFSNVILACAQLGVVPPADWLQAFSEFFELAMRNANGQHTANAAVALATLGAWDLPIWPSLWAQLCSRLPRDPADWDTENRLHARQLYQTYHAAAVERPGLLLATNSELLAAARMCWVDGGHERSSKLHFDVSACLSRMGIMHTNERWCERAARSIDIAIERAGAPVALEVDGPSHYLQDGRPNGSTKLRNRMLAAHGWRVMVVDYRTWIGLKTQPQQEEYLRRLIA